MNYLDLLPYDVLQLINRKVKEDYITKRRLERKENRRLNREQKQVADRRDKILEKFVSLYQQHLKNKYVKKIENHFDREFLMLLINDIYDLKNAKNEYKYGCINFCLDEEEDE